MKDEMRLRSILKPSSFLLVLALLAAPAALALECPPAPARWVTDAAGLLDASQVAALDQKLSAFEQESGHQFIVYTLPSIENDAIEDFTVRCAQRWGVGQKKFDNGLIVFLFLKEKKVRIEVGYGLEGAVTDAYSSRVIRDVMASHFQRGDWAGGLNAGADSLMQRIRGNEPDVAPLPQAQGGGTELASGNSRIFMLLLFVFIFFVLPMLMRGRRGCGGCLLPMMFMGGGRTFGGGGGFGGGGFGGGGFGGGGGGFGGGGATGGW